MLNLVTLLVLLLLAETTALVFLVWAVWPVIVTEWTRITGPDDSLDGYFAQSEAEIAGVIADLRKLDNPAV